MGEHLTQKLINAGADAVDEMLEGILAAHGDKLWRPVGSPRAVIARHGPRPGKVALVIGGGSGHEPTFLGFVGRGLADAAAVGNVFASPPPQPAVDAAIAANGGAGVLFMYGNYSGDVMNFDMASELLGMDSIEARTVLTTDDIASAPPAERAKRRGVAGNVFIFKAAGAAADRMMPLDEVVRVARHANDRTYTLGVALSPCSLPQTRRPNFDIAAGRDGDRHGHSRRTGDAPRALAAGGRGRRRDRGRDLRGDAPGARRPRGGAGQFAGRRRR